MAFPTFIPPVAPSPGTTDKPEFKVLTAEFGDGYTQSARDGMNNVRRVLSLQWDVLLPAQCAAIMDFLKARGGVEPFWYTPSNETRPVKWTCTELSDRRGETGLREVTATFKQSFAIG